MGKTWLHKNLSFFLRSPIAGQPDIQHSSIRCIRYVRSTHLVLLLLGHPVEDGGLLAHDAGADGGLWPGQAGAAGGGGRGRGRGGGGGAGGPVIGHKNAPLLLLIFPGLSYQLLFITELCSAMQNPTTFCWKFIFLPGWRIPFILYGSRSWIRFLESIKN